MVEQIREIIRQKQELLDELEECSYLEKVMEAAEVIMVCLGSGHKILLAGNGGSAADAQHFAGEMLGRFLMERNPIPAVALTTDASVMTCIANDYGYEEIFARQIEGMGEQGDVFIAISTSGNSQNLCFAINRAKEKGILTIGMLGKDGGSMKDMCDIAMVVPTDSTPRIQEIHTFTVHILCEEIEKRLFAHK